MALIAGQGGLPAVLARGLDGRDWRAWHLADHPPDGIASEGFRIERLGTLLAHLAEDGFTEVCFAGRVARPAIDAQAIDAATAPLVPRMMAALRQGDDAALRTVLSFFEEAGLRVVALQELVPGLMDVPQVGTPAQADRADIARAAELHRALSPLDVGQGLVVAGGQVLAIEALPGTDHMLDGLAAPFARPPGGVFYKAAKAGQDRRIDMATLGPDTVDRVRDAGLSGIAVERGAVLVLDADEMRRALTEAGLFLAVQGP
nr:UDP-2,3-diacylglucosamine diphosphatase LpxI [Jannaschia sp. S6380]